MSQNLGRLHNLDMHRLEPDPLILVPRQRQLFAQVFGIVPRPLVKDERKLVRVFGARQLGVQPVVVAVQTACGAVETWEARVVPLFDLGPGNLEVFFVVDDKQVLLGGVLDILLLAFAVIVVAGDGALFVGDFGCFVVCVWAGRV